MEWWRRFGPPSGNEPELTAPLGRYVIVTFVKGTDMGPYEAARHIPGVSGHELSYVANKHFSIVLLNEAVADLVNAQARLDLSQAWGDGTAVAADGTPSGSASATAASSPTTTPSSRKRRCGSTPCSPTR
ncbi:Tn3 family transposase [Streptomyces chattanoogensis]|uniref:Tn3 family transposase n=1 Tax=Streptomyces chattanoogensis TaxID=66876 RepID=UPI00099D2125|nr:Tn3 family transposase [Streptomyces chattanoogensis]